MKSAIDLNIAIQALQNKDSAVLARLITCCESNKIEDQQLITDILKYQQQSPIKDSVRIGITGAPGVGKSSFINQLGLVFSGTGHRLAVLSIDPSSEINLGSILGDKTRMFELSKEDNVFIRPSPSRNHLGGTNEYTRTAIQLCEMAGFDTIIIETVGIGQSEHEVSSLCDMTIWLGIAGAGDDLQAIKRGIMEHSDLLLINKAEDKNMVSVQATISDLESSLSLMPMRPNGKKATILAISALENKNVDKAYIHIKDFFNIIKENGAYSKQRQSQNVKYFNETWTKSLTKEILKLQKVKIKHTELLENIKTENLTIYEAANQLNDFIFAHLRQD